MKLKLIITAIFLCVLNIAADGQSDKLNAYDELDILARKYFLASNFDSAAILFKEARIKFPDHDEDATSKLNYIYLRSGQYSQAMENWAYGLKKGISLVWTIRLTII
ncbi:MAG: hypothetical protein HC831_12630 [Chloroflexia bacterium]|nr:hypothetical protein [Chloroflexia bacterium]